MIVSFKIKCHNHLVFINAFLFNYELNFMKNTLPCDGIEPADLLSL